MIASVTISDSREAEIAGAIRSVIDHVDLVLLVDTGITDRTLERAVEAAEGKLHLFAHPWVDFSDARNMGLKVARDLEAEWIVIVDSDERINFGALDLRTTLANARVDVLRLESDDGHYAKEKIIRAAASGVHYVGPTHEALLGGSRDTLAGATFSELGKTDEQLKRKFERDAKLLSAHVAANPLDPRWWYYLGASYEGLNDRYRAADAFGECLKRRKVGDEAGWAAYKQAEQLFILERFDKAIEAAARGMGACATSAECAWVAAVASWRLGRNDQSIAWARIAEAVGRYKGCGPDRPYFRHPPALYELPYDVLRETLPDLEGRRAADAEFHKAKRVRLGVSTDRELDRAGISLDTPVSKRQEIREMLRPGALAALCPSFRTTKIRFAAPGGWWPTNPSICWHKDELWCVVRTVNYTITGKQYSINDPDGVVRTENYLGRLMDGVLVGPHLMRDFDPAPRQPSKIVGYEDVRIVSIDGLEGPELAASATVCDRDANRRLIARLYLDKDGDVQHAEVQPSNQEHEKNWMPLSVDGELTWIYSLDPTAVLPGPLHPCPFALDHLRGGGVTETDDEFLCVMHETIDTNEGRLYLHRFVKLDEEFRVVGVSPAWVFAHHGIEFAAGMVLSGDKFVLSYGIRDQEAWVATVDAKEVDAMEWTRP